MNATTYEVTFIQTKVTLTPKYLAYDDSLTVRAMAPVEQQYKTRWNITWDADHHNFPRIFVIINKFHFCLTAAMTLAPCRGYQNQRWAIVPINNCEVLRICYDRNGGHDQGITWTPDGLSVFDEHDTRKSLASRFRVWRINNYDDSRRIFNLHTLQECSQWRDLANSTQEWRADCSSPVPWKWIQNYFYFAKFQIRKDGRMNLKWKDGLETSQWYAVWYEKLLDSTPLIVTDNCSWYGDLCDRFYFTNKDFEAS